MKNTILVLCTGNSCRSQICEAYLKQFGGESVEVYSAGVEIHGLNPGAIKTLLEDGIDISGKTSNHVDEYKSIQFDYIITVCDHANEVCPYIPYQAIKIHHSFTDPSKFIGTESERAQAFRESREEIKTWANEFINQHISKN